MRIPTELHLPGMALKSLLASVKSFQNLTVLNLRGNQIEILPRELNSLPLLVTLNVSENLLVSLQGLEDCLSRLKEVNVSENLINDAGMLPIFEQGRKLSKVDISGNLLSVSFAREVTSFLWENTLLADFQMTKVPLDSNGAFDIIKTLFWNYQEAMCTLQAFG